MHMGLDGATRHLYYLIPSERANALKDSWLQGPLATLYLQLEKYPLLFSFLGLWDLRPSGEDGFSTSGLNLQPSRLSWPSLCCLHNAALPEPCGRTFQD